MAEGAKINYYTTNQGNGDGSISFGDISFDGTVTADISLKGSNGNHFIELTKDGKRKGWTTACTPGAFQVEAGDLLAKENTGIFFNAKNGDVVIKATSGKLRLEANEIHLVAQGADGTEGNIEMLADGGNVSIKANNITFDSTAALKFVTTGVLNMNATLGMQILSPIVQGITCATKK